MVRTKKKTGFTPTPKKAPLFKAGMKWDVKNLPQESPVLQNGVWGFTLLELLIAATVIGVLVLIVVPTYQKSVWQMKEKKAVNNLYSIYNAEKSYFIENNNLYSNQDIDLQKHVGYSINDGDWTYGITIDNNVPAFTATATGTGINVTKHVYIDQTGSTSKDF